MHCRLSEAGSTESRLVWSSCTPGSGVGETMWTDMTRSRLIQVWFAAISLAVVAAMVVGATVTVGTAAMLCALSLVPPAIVLVLWPGVQPLTAAEVLHGSDRRA